MDYLKAVFRIRLMTLLLSIKSNLGNVTIHGSNCLYTISDSLKTVLLPLHNRNPAAYNSGMVQMLVIPPLSLVN